MKNWIFNIFLLLLLVFTQKFPAFAGASAAKIIEESAKALNFYAHVSQILVLPPVIEENKSQERLRVEVERTDYKKLDLFLKEIMKRGKNLEIRNVTSKKGLPLSQDDTFSFEVLEALSDEEGHEKVSQEHLESPPTPKKEIGLTPCRVTKADITPYLKKEKNIGDRGMRSVRWKK